jgi:thioredoxin-related protein
MIGRIHRNNEGDMLKRITFTMMLLLFPGGLIHAATELPWRTDIDQAFEQAAEQGKWLYVDFYTKSCPYCVKMDKEVYSRKDVADLLSKFVPLKVNAAVKTDFAQKYRVEAFPTAMVLTGEGNVIEIVEGYMPAVAFQERIAPLAAGRNPLEALERTAAENPDSATTQLNVGYEFFRRQWYDRSRSFLERGLKASSDPDLSEQSMRLIIASYLYESELEKVKTWVDTYREDFPDSEFLGPMYFDLGQIHFEREQYTDAARCFEKAKDTAEELMLRMRANWMLSEARGKLEKAE